jgi:hypothetical protein
VLSSNKNQKAEGKFFKVGLSNNMVPSAVIKVNIKNISSG